jgi:hypothetical protein
VTADAQPPPANPTGDGSRNHHQGDEPNGSIARGCDEVSDCVLCRLAAWAVDEREDALWCCDWPRYIAAAVLLADIGGVAK